MAKLNFKKIQDRLKDAALMGAGSVLSNQASGLIAKGLGANNNPKVNAGVRLAIAALGPSLLGTSKKDSMITKIADGMLAESAVALAKAFNVPGVSGTEIDESVNGYELNGTEVYDSVNGQDA